MSNDLHYINEIKYDANMLGEEIKNALANRRSAYKFRSLRIIDAWQIVDILNHITLDRFTDALASYNVLARPVKKIIPDNIIEFTRNKVALEQDLG